MRITGSTALVPYRVTRTPAAAGSGDPPPHEDRSRGAFARAAHNDEPPKRRVLIITDREPCIVYNENGQLRDLNAPQPGEQRSVRL